MEPIIVSDQLQMLYLPSESLTEEKYTRSITITTPYHRACQAIILQSMLRLQAAQIVPLLSGIESLWRQAGSPAKRCRGGIYGHGVRKISPRDTLPGWSQSSALPQLRASVSA